MNIFRKKQAGIRELTNNLVTLAKYKTGISKPPRTQNQTKKVAIFGSLIGIAAGAVGLLIRKTTKESSEEQTKEQPANEQPINKELAGEHKPE